MRLIIKVPHSFAFGMMGSQGVKRFFCLQAHAAGEQLGQQRFFGRRCQLDAAGACRRLGDSLCHIGIAGGIPQKRQYRLLLEKAGHLM